MITLSKTARLSALLAVTFTGFSAFAMWDGSELPTITEDHSKTVAAIFANGHRPNTAYATQKQLAKTITDVNNGCIRPLEWALKSGNYNDTKVQTALTECEKTKNALQSAYDALEKKQQ